MSAQSRRGLLDVSPPTTRLVLHELIAALSYANESAYLPTLYTAMFLIAFDGFFRVGEIAAKTKGLVRSLLQFRQLNFLPNAHTARTARITISEFKHNTSNRPSPFVRSTLLSNTARLGDPVMAPYSAFQTRLQ